MASSASTSPRPLSLRSGHDSISPGAEKASTKPDDVPLEVLVEHLLHAKRSLSSITLVLRANELATEARQLHEEAMVLSAQTIFLRRSLKEQIGFLEQLRQGLLQTYDWSKTDFDGLLKRLDASGDRLAKTMSKLSQTPVDAVFRPPGEEQKTLLDFTNEDDVESRIQAVQGHMRELTVISTSFDGDLLRFETDLRTLNKSMTALSSKDTTTAVHESIRHLLGSLLTQAQGMAEDLASLTRHFDMCVTAVRSTEGGAAMAIRRAADMGHSQTSASDHVSLSGVMGGAQDDSSSQSAGGYEPTSAEERAEAIAVVVQDAPEVDGAVAELRAGLAQMETDFASLSAQADRLRAAYTQALGSFLAVEDVGQRLRDYVAAEGEFLDRWNAERESALQRLEEMNELKSVFDKYLSAYSSLLFENERRRGVEDKVQGILRKARDSVQKLVDSDQQQREAFRQDVGDFMPTDLWADMNKPLRRWDLVPVHHSGKRQDEGT